MQNLQNHIFKYGLLTALALIAYFLIMRAVGLAEITELRFLNAVIMFGGVFLAIKKFRDHEFDNEFNYLTGISTGFFTGMVTGVSFSIFVTTYMYFDPVFMAAIVTENAQQDFLNPLTSGMVVLIEGIASGFLFSYMSMQGLKQDKTIAPENR